MDQQLSYPIKTKIMKQFFQILGSFLGILLLITLLAWFIEGNDFFMYKYFAPKKEQVRRETFEQSKAYNQGMIQELQNMQFEYIQADSIHKELLSSTILHRAADYDMDKLKTASPDLYDFIQKLKNKRNKTY